MPVITVGDETYAKLQLLARPFVDTEESVIAALADAELSRRGGHHPNGSGLTSRGQSDATGPLLMIDPDSQESLTHTRLLEANVDGTVMHKPKWNGLLSHLHVIGLKRFGSFDKLRQVSGANLREGRYEQEGFRYVPEAGFSIQGVDANLAWAHSLALARALNIPIRVRFEWRHKEGAARPGKMAVCEWAPGARRDRASS